MRSPWLRGGLIVIAAAYLLAGALSFLPDGPWLFEALSNVRAVLVCLGLAIALLLLFARLRITALVIALASAVNFFLALHPVDPVANVAGRAPNLRVMSIDIGANKHRDDKLLIQMIDAARPDILVLMGDTPAARNMIVSAAGFLPHHAETGVDVRGLSIDSRYELANTHVESPDPVTPILTAQITVPSPGGPAVIFFIAAHPLPPVQDWMARRRSAGLAALAKWTAGVDAPVVLAGDLSVTPQSEYFARLVHAGHLFDTARGASPPATWITSVPGLGLRLDHVLVSPDIEVAKRFVGADFGSRHLPLTVDLVIPAAR